MKRKKKCIFIIGFMASGKSTIGKELSDTLGYTYIDTDSIIEKQEKMPIHKLFDRRGERYFRTVESEVLKNIISDYENTNLVVSAGGGMPCSRKNLSSMKENGIVVYIKSNVDDIISRIKKSSERPVFHHMKKSSNLMDAVEALLKKREPCYSQADITVLNTNSTTARRAAAQIADTLQKEFPL